MRISTFLSFLLMMVCSHNISAQKLTVGSFTETNDIIAGADIRKDYNKQVCGIIKVQVTDDITNVEGNVMGDIVNKGVEKWVYMAKGSRQMVIHTKKHLPLKVYFRTHGIKELKSKRVYELVLQSPLIDDTSVDMPTGHLRLDNIPESATITISGNQQNTKSYKSDKEGRLDIEVPYGRYNYTVRAEGYENTEGSIFVNDEGKWQQISMNPIMGSITINCPTKGAEFYINGEEVSARNFPKSLVPNQYFVEVRKKKMNKGQMVTVQARQHTTVQIPDLKGNSGTITVSISNETEQPQENKQKTDTETGSKKKKRFIFW